MKLKNPGSAVDLDALGLVNVEHGQEVEATGEDAQNLLAQGWTRVDPPKPRKPRKTAAEKVTSTPTLTRPNPEKES